MCLVLCQIKWEVIWSYVCASGLPLSVVTVMCHVLFIAAQSGTNIWLSEWASGDNVTAEHAERDRSDERWNLTIYGALGGVQGDLELDSTL